MKTIDTFGRRSLLLFTFPQMMWTLLAAGLCTLMSAGPVRTGLVALFVYLFAMFYSTGEGPGKQGAPSRLLSILPLLPPVSVLLPVVPY